MPISRIRALSLTACLLLVAGAARAENPNFISRNSDRAGDRGADAPPQPCAGGELKHYQELRHYQVQYKGFAANLVGKMDVSVTFDAASGKSFRIVSQTGSKLLCDKVLKKAVDSEVEAAHDQAATALTPANYKFELAGSESVDGRPAYILAVEPVKESKFLYRGKIWVDAADFRGGRIKAEPAKNPSFWILRPQITFTSMKTGDFWLPTSNRSETKVRIGGTSCVHDRLRDLSDRWCCAEHDRDPLIEVAHPNQGLRQQFADDEHRRPFKRFACWFSGCGVSAGLSGRGRVSQALLYCATRSIVAALQLVREECSRAAFPMAHCFSFESSNSAMIAIASSSVSKR